MHKLNNNYTAVTERQRQYDLHRPPIYHILTAVTSCWPLVITLHVKRQTGGHLCFTNIAIFVKEICPLSSWKNEQLCQERKEFPNSEAKYCYTTVSCLILCNSYFFLSLFCLYLSLCLCFLLCYAVNKNLYILVMLQQKIWQTVNDYAVKSSILVSDWKWKFLHQKFTSPSKHDGILN